MPLQISRAPEKIPNSIIILISVICFLPLLANLVGVDFSSNAQSLGELSQELQAPNANVDPLFNFLNGAFNHALLEWTAVCIAIFTVMLSLSHYIISRDVIIPVIGLALFLAGCMDAFHTLAAARLIDAAADNKNLIPFTWALSRVFNALILILGVTVLLLRKPSKDKSGNTKFLLLTFVIAALFSYAIVHISAASDSLPKTQFPGELISRPFDVIPLLLFSFAAIFLLPLFYKRNPSVFSQALLVAMIPEILLECHMAFGSSQLFDNHFNIAHFLKVIAYTIPLIGLMIDYIKTYKDKEVEVEQRIKAQNSLKRHADELARSNQELNNFAYVASHDLKAPLRGIAQLVSWVDEDIGEDIGEDSKEHLDLIKNRVNRLELLLDDLLSYSRIGRDVGSMQEVNFDKLCHGCFDVLGAPGHFKFECKADLALFNTLQSPLQQIIRNLLNNAIKHHDKDSGAISISAIKGSEHYLISVSDDGPGIKPDHHERVFVIFQSLKPRDEVEGSGMGLSIVKKILDQMSCKIWIDSDGKNGTKINFEWPLEDDLKEQLNARF